MQDWNLSASPSPPRLASSLLTGQRSPTPPLARKSDSFPNIQHLFPVRIGRRLCPLRLPVHLLNERKGRTLLRLHGPLGGIKLKCKDSA
jgi:hypothetical protein